MSLLPLHNLISNLVFAINGSHVKDVYIDGNQVVDKGLVLGVNEELIYAKARDRAEDIRRLLNLTADTLANDLNDG